MTAAVALSASAAGGVGAVARAVLDTAVRSVADARRRSGVGPRGRRRRVGGGPLDGLLVVNGVGSIVLGALAGMTVRAHVPVDLATVVGTGFCGGFTTWSGAAWGVAEMVRDGRTAEAARAAAAGVVLPLLAAALGTAIGGGW